MPTNGDDFIDFQGTLGQLTTNLVNAYSGKSILIDDEYNINTGSYDGLDGFDTLLMSNFGDYLSVENIVGVQMLANIERISAGNGGDIINLSSNNIVLGDISVFGGDGHDILWGNAGNDSIFGGKGNDIIDGGPGDDDLRGEAGNDQISGGDGNDELDGGLGDDLLIGGLGNDSYEVGRGHDTVIELASTETNILDLRIAVSHSAIIYTPSAFDLEINFGGGNLVTIIDQFAGDGSGVDTMKFFDLDTFTEVFLDLRSGVIFSTPTQGNDVLTGSDGDDVISGLGGNDTISGGLGSDLLDGGAGDDVLIYSADAAWPSSFVAWNVGAPGAVINGDRVTVNPRDRSHDGFNGGEGTDTIQMGDAGDALFLDDRYSPNPFGTNTARLIDVEIIRAGGGNDIIDLTSKQFSYGDVSLYGEAGDDVLWGNAGHDYIDGGTGDDHLDGASGNDTLVGGAGDDKMYGWSGDDTFIVGEGIDQIYTGSGSDTIIYDMLDGLVDTFHDFSTGAGGDALNISSILQGYDPVSDAISDFVQLVQNGGDTEVHINADGDVGGTFTAIAAFDGGINDTLVDLINNGNLLA